ncbi:type II and III secretion system protein family protein [Phenylobacterium sp.]|uniref:type II and III secretion system protein family protein n=1 Tax=Phenylobacterium sp. TaxID=1871053 RepID=UPI002C729B3F|nr:type II and III secretion system protein family protein [Phenylobacterium sp.]HLZ73975.1 type II and III secretion system protein family protein [Phenylobacterium sp.]
MSRHLATALCATVSLLAATAAATPVFADQFASEAAPVRTISVPKDKALSFRLDEPASKIVVSQPDIAEVVATTDRSFYVRGLDVGSTNLLVYGPGGRLLQMIDVRVGFDARALQSDIDTAFPGEAVKVQTLGEGLLLTGTVSSTSVATRAKAMADKFAPDGATSALLVSASQEVVLEVRVMEATRSSLQDAGFSGAITSGNTTMNFGSGLIGNTPANGVLGFATHAGVNGVNLSLQALEEKGIVRTLAKPTLVAVSGGKASFLAGGEFPYPVPQGLNQITLEFRQYGVKLDFTPTVQDNGLIRLAVAPEVSQLDQTNSIKIDGVQVPGLITRKADTTVEIRDGDSLALGGMFMHTYNNDLRQFPGLGDIPILGALFRSARWARNETELIIIVTPHIVTARDFERAGKTADIATQEPSTLGFMVGGQVSKGPPMSRDMRGPIAPPPPASPVASASSPAASVTAPTTTPAATPVAAATPTLPLRGEITAAAVPASGK